MFGATQPGAFPSIRLATSPEEDATIEQRAALWSIYFHRFADPRRGLGEAPLAVRPISRHQALGILTQTDGPDRHTLRRSLAHLLATGYTPDPDRKELFQALLADAARVAPRHAEHHLRAIAQNRYIPPPGSSVQTLRLDGRSIPLPKGRSVPLPTMITLASDEATVTSRTLVPHDLKAVAPLVEPQHWTKLGPFFEETRLRSKHRLYERFGFDWNMMRFERFNVHLNVDCTETKDIVRADYSLIHEESDKILVDDGSVEARRPDGAPAGWTLFTGKKTVRFAAGYMNVLAAVVMSMFLESNGEWLQRAIEDPAGTRRG
jgi:hypothetical protein